MDEHRVTPVHNFRQHHHDIAQMVDQAFLRLDLHPKDGLLEMNELTTVFTTRDTDGSWFNINSTNQITIDFHFTLYIHIVIFPSNVIRLFKCCNNSK